MKNQIRLSGEEIINDSEQVRVRDFWSWAYSDIMDNRNRGVFGEFIVTCALGVHDSIRREWDAVDLKFQGVPIEVKTSAYLQTWNQKGLSRITFGIGKRKSWDADTNQVTDVPLRSSRLYVFCLLHETRIELVNPLDLNQWSFYLVPTDVLNELYPESSSISLRPLEKLCSAISYQDLRARIVETIQEYHLIV